MFILPLPLPLSNSHPLSPLNNHKPSKLSPPRRPRPPTCTLSDHIPSPPSDYNSWSSEFLALCDAQLHLLLSTLPSLSQALLLFRREHPTTGSLEFVPLVVHTRTASTTRRVWISAPGSAARTEVGRASGAPPLLPGGIPARWLLPDYPFSEPGPRALPDGALVVPVEYNGVLAGSLVLQGGEWGPEEVERADVVARSIAMGAALEGKWAASAGRLGVGRGAVESMQALLRRTLHQVRSPVSALVTFGHLLLKKLPPGDSNRALAKNIILQSLRLDDLLGPLDEVTHSLVMSEATVEEDGDGAAVVVDVDKREEYSISKPDKFTKQVSTEGLQLLWLSDVLLPQADVTRLLAEEKELVFHSNIDEDTSAVLAVEKFVREAISNLLDNALKYSPPGAHIGIICVSDELEEDKDNRVEVIVWDTGYGFSESEKDDIWQLGHRGSASILSGSTGSGIGLAFVKEMLDACGAQISLVSPLPAYLDPRPTSETPRTPGSAFHLRFRRPSA